MRRFALAAAFSLLATAAIAAQSGPPARAVGVDQAGIDQSVRPGDGFDRLCEWRLAQGDADPERPRLDRLLPDRRPAGRAAEYRHHRQCRPVQSRRRHRRPPDRGLLCRLSEPRRDRRARRSAAPAASRPDRRHCRPARALRRARRQHARRRRSAERDHLRHRESVRRLRRAGAAGSEPQPCLSAAGRPRPARPRLLPLRRARTWSASARATAPISATC